MKRFLPALLMAALLLLWEAFVRLGQVPLYVLPAPSQVAAALIAEAPALLGHALVSLAEALAGMGIALSLMMNGVIRLLERALAPYVALDQGYYAEAGLNVSIIEPTEGATATLIAVSKGDFGVSYQEDVTMALASADPLPIRAIAAVIQHNTSGFATSAGKCIASPADFEGKTYAGWGGPGEEAVLRAVMQRAGVDFSKLNMVISDGSGFAALRDQADIMWFFEGWDNVKCKLADFPIDYMELRQLDERLDYYTPVLIASERMIEEKPGTVRAFLAATAKGYAFAEQNPERSAEILHAYAPDYSLDMLTMSQTYLSAKYSEDAPRWGEMKDEVWDGYTELLVEYGVIDHAIPAAACYTNAFLPEAQP